MRKLIVNDKYEFRSRYYADSEGHIWSENKKYYLSYKNKDTWKQLTQSVNFS